MIPAHLVAEAISTLHGLDLRWSGPITPTEMQYVEEYVLAKYPEYGDAALLDDTAGPNPDYPDSPDDRVVKKSPKTIRESAPHSDTIPKVQLEPSKLVDALAKKSSSPSAMSFVSIPEIQARNRALHSCGVTEAEYLVVFTPSVREAMMMVGESYPFFRGNYYMTVLEEEGGGDVIREFAGVKDSKVVAAPAAWLDLRIKGSQLSQYFRRKCKYSPKGLFAYAASVKGTRSSMHWISEAHRNSWHVLLDAAGAGAPEECLPLALHRPDFVTCTVEVTHGPHPSRLTCLLVRRKSFEAAVVPTA